MDEGCYLASADYFEPARTMPPVQVTLQSLLAMDASSPYWNLNLKSDFAETEFFAAIILRASAFNRLPEDIGVKPLGPLTTIPCS